MQPKPKVFISYSWTSSGYQEEVLNIADRLAKAGVEIVIDEYDLKEGQDVDVFMERLKTDESLHFCLVLSDAAYARKADSRKNGVGTEAQIISRQVYESTDQTKFIPVVMEKDENGQPCLPTFLQSRKYISFASPEEINQNWEKLLRLLYGKPARVKPKLGEPPQFAEKEDAAFAELKVIIKTLRGPLMDGKPGVGVLRDEAIEAFCQGVDVVTASESVHRSDDLYLEEWEKQLREIVPGRDVLIDWILMEAKTDPEVAVSKCIAPLLEKITEKIRESGKGSRPIAEDVLSITAYELGLYSVACLINADSPEAIRSLLDHPFPKKRDSYREPCSIGLRDFRHYSRMAEAWNQQQTRQWLSPEAQKVKERATHQRIGFTRLVEAEADIFVTNTLNDHEYYPSTAAYAENGPRFPWFDKARISRNPDRLAIAMRKESWDSIREEFIQKFKDRLRSGSWRVFSYGGSEYLESMGFNK